MGKVSLKSVKVILFDWDGTLIDSLSIKAQNAGQLFAQTWGLSPESVAQSYRRHSGIPRRQLFDAILSDHRLPPLGDEQFVELSRQFSLLNLRALCDGEILRAETRDTLRRLAEQGLRLYVSSSAEAAEIEQIAQNLGIRRYFQEILGSKGKFTKGKPHVDYILQKEQVTKQEVAFVGDDLADIRLGRQAGVITIGKSGTQSRTILEASRADFVIDEIESLLALFLE